MKIVKRYWKDTALVVAWIIFLQYFLVDFSDVIPFNVKDTRIFRFMSSSDELQYSFYNNVSYAIPPKIPGITLINKSLCPKRAGLKYILVVYSLPGNFKRRSAIRNTWGHSKLFTDERTRIVFVLGQQSNDTDVQDRIQKEAGEFHDILQGDFEDEVENLGTKGILTIKWLVDYCSEVKYVLKTKDDMFINLFKILDMTASIKEEKFMICPFYKDNQQIIQRAPMDCDRLCIPEITFKGFTYYPKYCSGSVWLFPITLAKDILRRIHITNYFFHEDVYISGLILPQIPKVKIVDIFANTSDKISNPGIVLKDHEGKFVHQYKDENEDITLIAVDVPNTGTLHQYWNLALDRLDNKYASVNLNAAVVRESRLSKN